MFSCALCCFIIWLSRTYLVTVSEWYQNSILKLWQYNVYLLMLSSILPSNIVIFYPTVLCYRLEKFFISWILFCIHWNCQTVNLDPRGLVGDLEQNAISGTIFVRLFICGLSILSYQSIWVHHFYFIIWYTTVLAHLHPFHHSKMLRSLSWFRIYKMIGEILVFSSRFDAEMVWITSARKAWNATLMD
jgi:hypothetical protein